MATLAYSLLSRIAVSLWIETYTTDPSQKITNEHTSIYARCNALHHTGMHCNTLQCTATRWHTSMHVRWQHFCSLCSGELRSHYMKRLTHKLMEEPHMEIQALMREVLLDIYTNSWKNSTWKYKHWCEKSRVLKKCVLIIYGNLYTNSWKNYTLTYEYWCENYSSTK